MPDSRSHEGPPVHTTAASRWVPPILYLLAVVILGLVARQVVGPLDVDSGYYFLVARNLGRGQGLAVDAVWHFFHPVPGWPQPAGDLWMPVPSLLMAPAMLLGDSFRHAQIVQVLLAALLPLLAFRIAREQGAELPWATLAGLLTVFAGTVTVHWVDSDCYTAYALAGAAALYAMGRGRENPRWLIVAGALGGLATLTRNDGVLLLVVLWAQTLLVNRHQRRRIPWRPLLLATVLFLVPLALWGLRNALTFGGPTSAPLSFLLTMRDYRELFAYRPRPDWAAFWQQGWGTFFSLRREALGTSLTLFAASFQVWGLIPLAWSAVSARRRPGVWPAWLYLLVLFVTLNLAFPLLVTHGTWSRSMVAFLPTGYACVALGLREIVEGLLRWRPNVPARLLGGTFLWLGLIAAVLVGRSAMSLHLQAASAEVKDWQEIGAWLQDNTTPEQVIMAQDPMAALLYGERRSIGIPFEELPELLGVANEYGISHIVLVERFSGLLPQALHDLYAAGTTQSPLALIWGTDSIQIYQLEP